MVPACNRLAGISSAVWQGRKQNDDLRDDPRIVARHDGAIALRRQASTAATSCSRLGKRLWLAATAQQFNITGPLVGSHSECARAPGSTGLTCGWAKAVAEPSRGPTSAVISRLAQR